MTNNSSYSNTTTRIFAWLFLSTGVFAIVGALYTWGEGWLFSQADLTKSLIPMADLYIAGPLSLIAGYGIWVKKHWGINVGLMASGVYIFGAALVYIMMVWKGLPYNLNLIIPPLFGIGIAISFFVWVTRNQIAS